MSSKGERCAACGHSDYHCPVSGCNHHNGEDWCDCEKFVPRLQGRMRKAALKGKGILVTAEECARLTGYNPKRLCPDCESPFTPNECCLCGCFVCSGCAFSNHDCFDEGKDKVRAKYIMAKRVQEQREVS